MRPRGRAESRSDFENSLGRGGALGPDVAWSAVVLGHMPACFKHGVVVLIPKASGHLAAMVYDIRKARTEGLCRDGHHGRG